MRPVLDLLDDLPVNLPIFADGECLYSWCALYHRLSGNAVAKHSCVQLFGAGGREVRHDFPTRLAAFCVRTRNVLGTPESLAMQRTMLGYYAPFASLRTYRRALGAMSDGKQEDTKHVLGLMASRVGASHPLKACPACVRRDLNELGYSRWMLEHQWPSVWVCRHHGNLLRSLTKHSQPRNLREWTLPKDHATGEWSDIPKLPASSGDRLMQIASVSVCLNNISVLFDRERLRLAYRIGAKRRGWVAFDGTLRLAAMTRELQESFGNLTLVPGFGFLKESDPNGGGVLGLLTRQVPGLHHPAKHAVLTAFLFESMDEFIDAYRMAGHTTEGDRLTVLVGDWRNELRRLVESERWSVSRAANSVGVPTSRACCWLESVGVPVVRRPRVMDDEKRDQIVSLLQAGKDYQDIAELVSVKKGIVRAFAAANPEVRDHWRQRRFELLRDEHRNRALGLFATNYGVSLKNLKSVPGNGLAWLERHDREWLSAHAPNLFGSA